MHTMNFALSDDCLILRRPRRPWRFTCRCQAVRGAPDFLHQRLHFNNSSRRSLILAYNYAFQTRVGANSSTAPRVVGVRATAESSVAEQESLQLLEWPALCSQVACFTQTAMGAEIALTGKLPLGDTQEASENLLQQTAEAQEAQLDLKGTFDVRRALAAANAGLVLHPLVLGAIGLTLQAAQRVDSALKQHSEGYLALGKIAAGLHGGVEEVQEPIFTCLQVNDGRLLDEASVKLARIRAERKQNMMDLRKMLDDWSRLLHSKGVSERPQVVIRRDRLCIPVRAGRQGELPKGSLTLATSASGNTMYMEPEPVVQLNNLEMRFAREEQEEEERILSVLSRLVEAHTDSIERILHAITALDVATARGRHATWLGARRPAFLSTDAARSGGAVNISRAWHPLLLQPCLSPLPLPPVVDLPPGVGSSSLDATEDETGHSFNTSPSLQNSGLSLVPELVEEPASVAAAGAKAKIGSHSATVAGSNGVGDLLNSAPEPTQLTIPKGVKVVAVTGPNTGGKTASLKALGLLSLMAKAGCFIPQAPWQDGEGSDQEEVPPKLLWFDKILADLGDGQSLQQSLSTFSGHIRRIRNILGAVTDKSLVLLDEVGSGTDPTEGAALAAALLDRLHKDSALTYATTHHAELKKLASNTPGFVNASVEFDISTLQPTYRLLWGLAGESNALAVAEGLGFDTAVVARAREVASQLHTVQQSSERAELLQRSLISQLSDAEQLASQALSAKSAGQAELDTATKLLSAAQQEVQQLAKNIDKGKTAVEVSKNKLHKALAAARGGKISIEEAEEVIRVAEQLGATANRKTMAAMAYKLADKEGVGVHEFVSSTSSKDASHEWVPRQGERVQVKKMGGAPGMILSAPQGAGVNRKCNVKVGALTMEMRVSDLAPLGDSPSPLGGTGRSGTARGANTSGIIGRKQAGQKVSSAGGMHAQAAKVKEKLKAEVVLAASSSQADRSSSGGGGIAIQTSRNTVDVRGQNSDVAVSTVELALSRATAGSVLFVVHGVGTGRVRAAVRDALRQSRLVKRTEEQEESLGGCTIVYTN